MLAMKGFSFLLVGAEFKTQALALHTGCMHNTNIVMNTQSFQSFA
jgi:hypothetical protein